METTAYRINALLLGAKIEADQDIHLVVADPKHPTETMIVELPNAPSCRAGTSPARARADFVFYTGHANGDGWVLSSPDAGSLHL